MKYLSLNKMCEELSISLATGRNWLKLGKIHSAYVDNNMPYFDAKEVANLKQDMITGKSHMLKSRRNKKFISGNSMYNSYVSKECKNINAVVNTLKHIDNCKAKLDEDLLIRCLLAGCALSLIQNMDMHAALIDDLIPASKVKQAKALRQQYPELFQEKYTYEAGEDILGLLYISCRNLGNRKAKGAYYTPNHIVKKLISNTRISSSDRILDPCCGTGNFLLQLPNTVDFSNVYGNDLDELSVKITRINMALKYPNVEASEIKKHISHKNFLTHFKSKKFDLIIGNPPWGYDFSKEERIELKEKYLVAGQNSLESYNLFIEAGLKALNKMGQLSFVIPEAILNVKAHKRIRQYIIDNCSINYLAYLGDSFDGVNCPSIILSLQKNSSKQATRAASTMPTNGMIVESTNTKFTIETNRSVSADFFNFNMTDDEYKLINGIREKSNIVYLKDNADFALGIVTGNNKKFITHEKNKHNELILKGTDIEKYHITRPDRYIVFSAKQFQQCAPEALYRAREKLFYRFIGGRLIFAYDDKQTVSLNSCNIVIPRIDGLEMKYILAVLNSSMAQFIFEKEYNSIKVLKSHIEGIPIPVVDMESQTQVIQMVNQLIEILEINSTAPQARELSNQIDKLICSFYQM